MPETVNEKIYLIDNFEGMQVRSNRFIKQKGELDYAQNVTYDEVGSIGKRLGYAQRATNLTSTSTSSSSSTTISTSSSTSISTTSSSTSVSTSTTSTSSSITTSTTTSSSTTL